MAKVLGIDLGTTNSCVAVIEVGEAQVLENSDGLEEFLGASSVDDEELEDKTVAYRATVLKKLELLKAAASRGALTTPV